MILQKEHNLENMIYSNKMDNEPEEGEIVDYYEIISSDEEYMVRQRIKELEAKNKEIEQIAVISNSYPNYSNIPYPHNNFWNKNYAHINRNNLKRKYKRSDASSISSNEYATSRKHKSRRNKDPRAKHLHRHFRNHGKQSECRRKHSSRHLNNGTSSSRHKRFKDENDYYEIYSDSSSSVQCYSNEYDIRYLSDENDDTDRNNYIDRNTLRFAVGRNFQHSTSARSKATLKERLLNREQRKERRTGSNLMQMKNEDNPQIQTIDDSSDSLEEKELRLIALKSAIHKKHMQRKKRDAETAYSPTDFENLFDSNHDNKNDIEMDLVGDGEIQGIDNTSSPISSPKLLLSPPHCAEETQCSQSCMVNTKVVDMEIATSDSDIEPPKWLTIPTLPSDSHWGNANDIDFKNAFKLIKSEEDQQHQMDIHLPGIKFESTQPPPNFIMNVPEEIPANPPPFHEENITVEEMEIDCIDITEKEEPIKISTEEDEEEEELALRALLLSQFQTAKQKRDKKTTNPSSEFILKEAVRRFKSNTKENNTISEIKPEDHLNNTEFNLNNHKIITNQMDDGENNESIKENHQPLEKSNSHLDTIQPIKECVQNPDCPQIPQDCCPKLLSNNSLMDAMKKNMLKGEEEANGKTLTISNQMIEDCPKKLPETAVEKDHKPNGAKCNLQTITSKIENRNIKVQDKKINNNVLNSSRTLLPTYSVLRSRKIIKPNKIINNVSADIQRKTFQKGQKNANNNHPNSKNINTKLTNPLDENQKLENNSNNDNRFNTRLITNIEQAKTICKVPNLIINLNGHSSSPSSLSHSSSDSATEDTYDTSLHVIADYHDNDSPISLNLDNNTSYSPSAAITDNHGNIDDAKFEDKLNDFLKTIRSKVQQESISEQQVDVLPAVKKPKPLANTNSEVSITPKAVRHLPQATQDEYRRLVYRMKMLENRRKSSQNAKTPDQSNKIDSVKKPPTAINNSKTNSKLNALRKKSLKNKNSNNNNEISNNSNNENAENRNDLNPDMHFNHKSAQTSVQAAVSVTAKTTTTTTAAAATDLYEKFYKKIGADINDYLEQSLHLVENAKSAKIKKLYLENRISAMKKEIDLLEKQQRLEQLKITKIYPNIRKTNTIITNLKHKRLQILKALLGDGNKIPSEIRNDNDLKLQISEKSKQLLENIKLVNSLEKHNIHKYIKMENDKAKNSTDGTTSLLRQTRQRQRSGGKQHDDKRWESEEDNNNKPPADFLTLSIKKKKANSNLPSSAITSMTTSRTSPSFPSAADANASSALLTEDFHHTAKDGDVLKRNSRKNSNAEIYSNNSASPTDASNDGENVESNRSYLTYISPLDHLTNTQSDLDPQAILCPFDLRGSCQDDGCCYLHLKQDVKKRKKQTNRKLCESKEPSDR